MPHRKFTRRLSPWLTLYLLVASVGLPLQRVYCACIGQSEISLPGAEHACSEHQVSCHAPEDDEHQQRVTMSHDCGSSEVVMAALDADYFVENSQLPAVVDIIAAAPRPIDSVTPVKLIAKTRPVRGPTPPSRPAGRQLLVAHQTFLI